MEEKAAVKEKKPRKPKHSFLTTDKEVFKYSPDVDKWMRDTIVYHRGEQPAEKGTVTVIEDPNRPLDNGQVLKPGKQSPICTKCGLDEHGANNPYIPYGGPKDPIITVLFDSVSKQEDAAGVAGGYSWSKSLAEAIDKLGADYGISSKDVRWVPVTRCANYEKKMVNYKTKGNWCRMHAVQDLMLHPPRMVIPIGTQALGLLCHKSNAEDWSGKLLTYRGWPDDWLTDKDYMLPRPDPLNSEKTVVGHPLFGPAPTDFRIPMVPMQAPRMVLARQSQQVMARWRKQLAGALKMASEGVAPRVYERPWYFISDDPAVIMERLEHLIKLIERNPELLVCYDTETTGLRPWSLESIDPKTRESIITPAPKIVFMMFRWTNPETGKPESLGFPWDYDESPVQSSILDIAPLVIRVLITAVIVGHNITFDMLFSAATIPGAPLDAMADRAKFDTWHMAYTLKQQRGTLGLDAIAYEHVPDLAGYEEEMTLLIELFKDLLHPGAGKGGHYAKCPKEKWDSHLRPYVMGDVEVAYQTHGKLLAKLNNSRVYDIPLANPHSFGRFRRYTPPNRAWVYENIMSPASRMLTKVMGRGLYVDRHELLIQEEKFPQKVLKAKEDLKSVDPRILSWVERKMQEDTEWEFDLENKGLLKDLMFNLLNLPVQRLTKNGKKMFGESPEEWEMNGITPEQRYEFAATDKFTLNKLAVDHPQIRPLQSYRKIFKLYSTYVRPLRNLYTEGIDKKTRTKDPHLAIDSCVHASFLLTGTRGGRLSCKDPNLQQLPSDGEVKRMFTSRFGARGCMYTSDLSQIELRLLAAACGDSSMIKAYFDNVDLHSLTTSKIFKLDYDQFSKKHMETLQKQGRADEAKKLDLKRKIGKTVNFLTGYGGGAFGLQTTLANSQIYLPIEECEHIIESFFDAYPSLRKFLGYYKNFISENGVAVSIFGRVRIFEEVFSEDKEAISKALRAGSNHLIQSTASDMMLVCLTVIENLMREYGLESMLVSTVHDSLLIDAVTEELDSIHEIVDGVLNNIPTVLKMVFGEDYDDSWMIVPFAGDSEVGMNYLDSNKVPVGKGRGDIDWGELLASKKKDK